MYRPGSPVLVTFIGVFLTGLSGCDLADATAAAGASIPIGGEAEFAALQARGQQAMGVDQYTSSHVFDALPHGGRIELQRDVADPDGTARIRAHLEELVRAFEAGEFSTPEFVHAGAVPGASTMAAKRDVIRYVYRDLPRGGEVRILTQDPQALEAIHEFMSFQRQEHRAGGMGHGGHADMDHVHHGGRDHPPHGDADHPPHGDVDHPPHGDVDHPPHGGVDHLPHGDVDHPPHGHDGQHVGMQPVPHGHGGDHD